MRDAVNELCLQSGREASNSGNTCVWVPRAKSALYKQIAKYKAHWNGTANTLCTCRGCMRQTDMYAHKAFYGCILFLKKKDWLAYEGKKIPFWPLFHFLLFLSTFKQKFCLSISLYFHWMSLCLAWGQITKHMFITSYSKKTFLTKPMCKVICHAWEFHTVTSQSISCERNISI